MYCFCETHYFAKVNLFLATCAKAAYAKTQLCRSFHHIHEFLFKHSYFWYDQIFNTTFISHGRN